MGWRCPVYFFQRLLRHGCPMLMDWCVLSSPVVVAVSGTFLPCAYSCAWGLLLLDVWRAVFSAQRYGKSADLGHKGSKAKMVAKYKAAIQRAALDGDGTAQVKLGMMHKQGREVPQSDAEAVRWFSVAAQQGQHCTARCTADVDCTAPPDVDCTAPQM